MVVGGGYIALEFAGIFNGLGAKTTVLYRGEQMLRGFDHDVRNFLQPTSWRRRASMSAAAPTWRASTRSPGGTAVTLSDGSTIDCDQVLYATGRRPLTRNMGLEKVGVALDEIGAIKVDGWSKSSVPNIYAVGDCTNRVNLTPVAIREGHAFADSVFGKQPWRSTMPISPPPSSPSRRSAASAEPKSGRAPSTARSTSTARASAR